MDLSNKQIVVVGLGVSGIAVAYSRRFAEPLRQLGDLYNQVQGALAGAERYRAFLEGILDLDYWPDRIEEGLPGRGSSLTTIRSEP